MRKDIPSRTTGSTAPERNPAKVTWDVSKARTLYPTAIKITAAREHISLIFGIEGKDEGQGVRVTLTDQVILSPFVAKQLAILLDEAIRVCGIRHGEIKPSAAELSHERDGAIFQALANLRVETGCERSFKIVSGGILDNRFLLGVSRGADKAVDKGLLDACGMLGMPGELLDAFSRNLPRTSCVSFGFEQEKDTVVYEVCLDFEDAERARLDSSLGPEVPQLLRLGLKWDPASPSTQAVTSYTWFPRITPGEILQRVGLIFGEGPHDASEQAAENIVSLACSRIPHQDILYIEATEEGNPRRSFDINVFRAGLTVAEVYPILSTLYRSQAVPFELFHTLYEKIKGQRFDHLAGGIDRQGRDFLTVYHWDEGITKAGLKVEEERESVIAAFHTTLPERKRRPVRVEEEVPKAELLYRSVRNLWANTGLEHSFKLLEGTLLADRLLMGIWKTGGLEGREEDLLGICRIMEMPEDFLEAFRDGFGEADTFGFGFEKGEKGNVYKAYLEFNQRLKEAMETVPMPESIVAYQGFKWDANDNSRKILAQYRAVTLFTASDIARRLERVLYRDRPREIFGIVDDVLNLAGSRTGPGKLILLEASEEGNPRASFDLNFYKAGLTMEEIYPLIMRMGRCFNIDPAELEERYEDVKTRPFGHLSGGIDREGRDFLTVYFEDCGPKRVE